MSDISVTNLPDGRELAWAELGDLHGPAVFVFHGTPGSHRQVCVDEEPITATGVRFVAPDRPGYGHSTFQKRRRLRDWPADVAYLADHLGIDEFSVVGVSGGGPHALACAAFLPDRVVGTGVVSGIGCVAEPGTEEGMMGWNVVVTRLARRSASLVQPLFAGMTVVGRRWPEFVFDAGTKSLPACDLEVISRPKVKTAFIEDYRLTSRTNARAAAQDFGLFAHDWGFRIEDITGPVHIWCGSEDRNVPTHHGRSFAQRISNSRLHECPGEGHLLLADHAEEVLRTLCAERGGGEEQHPSPVGRRDQPPIVNK